MKTKLLLAATAVVLGLATSGSALAANGALALGISGSPHDFGGEAWNSTGELCRVCHAPHDKNLASQRYTNGLLWNHEVSAASYTIYDFAWSSSIDGATRQPDGTAKLCLGCHDGTVGVDAFEDVTPGPTLISSYNPAAQIPSATAGTDLHGTHPISIDYDPVADTNLHPVTDTMGTSGTIDDVLDAGKVQCSSCHDVHDSDTVASTSLLRVSNTSPASGLCLTCHIK